MASQPQWALSNCWALTSAHLPTHHLIIIIVVTNIILIITISTISYMLGIPGSHLIRQMLRTRMAKCFAPTLRLNPSPASETGMPYLHLGEPGMPSQLRVNFPRRLMRNLERGVLQGKTTSNLVDGISISLQNSCRKEAKEVEWSKMEYWRDGGGKG